MLYLGTCFVVLVDELLLVHLVTHTDTHHYLKKREKIITKGKKENFIFMIIGIGIPYL